MEFKKKCVKCGAEVEFGAFGPCKRQPGNHTVESETYYHPGARDIQDVKDRRKFSPTIVLQPSYDYVDDATKKVVKTKGLTVQFQQSGKFETDDPEIQYHLEQKPDIAWGPEGLKMWQKIYLTEQQQVDVAKAELAEVERKVREQNDLLAAVKAQKQGARANAAV